jgi:hypothetical protein
VQRAGAEKSRVRSAEDTLVSILFPGAWAARTWAASAWAARALAAECARILCQELWVFPVRKGKEAPSEAETQEGARPHAPSLHSTCHTKQRWSQRASEGLRASAVARPRPVPSGLYLSSVRRELIRVPERGTGATTTGGSRSRNGRLYYAATPSVWKEKVWCSCEKEPGSRVAAVGSPGESTSFEGGLE